MPLVKLVPLDQEDRDQFILDNQEAFNYGALEEFGLRDDHFEEDEQIISRETIERSIDGGEAYRILEDGIKVGVTSLRLIETIDISQNEDGIDMEDRILKLRDYINSTFYIIQKGRNRW